MFWRTAAACAATAAIAIVVSAALGWWRIGVAIALGLTVGVLNGPLARRGLSVPLDLRISSLARMAALSGLGIGLGWLLLGVDQVPFVIGGIAVAQLFMAGAGVVEVLRA